MGRHCQEANPHGEAGHFERLGDPARPQNDDYPDHVRFDWTSIDQWYEEDEEVFVHPRDPYSRIDIIPTSRRVEVLIDDTVMADSTSALFLFETRLPRRTYIPPADVRLDLSEPTSTTTRCPYKDIASYRTFHIGDTTHEDIAWYYPEPIWQAAPLADHIAFFDEKVRLRIDGELEDQPRSIFSSEIDPQP